MINSTIDYGMIGKRIKDRRRKLNITQEKMAEDINLSTFYISKIENGRSASTLDTLSVIANYLSIDLSYLITGTSTLEQTYYMDQLQEICSNATNKQLNLILKIAKNIIED